MRIMCDNFWGEVGRAECQVCVCVFWLRWQVLRNISSILLGIRIHTDASCRKYSNEYGYP